MKSKKQHSKDSKKKNLSSKSFISIENAKEGYSLGCSISGSVSKKKFDLFSEIM